MQALKLNGLFKMNFAVEIWEIIHRDGFTRQDSDYIQEIKISSVVIYHTEFYFIKFQQRENV